MEQEERQEDLLHTNSWEKKIMSGVLFVGTLSQFPPQHTQQDKVDDDNDAPTNRWYTDIHRFAAIRLFAMQLFPDSAVTVVKTYYEQQQQS